MQFASILSLSIAYTQAVEWILNFIVIFTGYANTTSTLIGVEGGRWWGATKWQIKGTSELKTAKWHQLVLVSAPHNTQNS